MRDWTEEIAIIARIAELERQDYAATLQSNSRCEAIEKLKGELFVLQHPPQETEVNPFNCKGCQGDTELGTTCGVCGNRKELLPDVIRLDGIYYRPIRGGETDYDLSLVVKKCDLNALDSTPPESAPCPVCWRCSVPVLGDGDLCSRCVNDLEVELLLKQFEVRLGGFGDVGDELLEDVTAIRAKAAEGCKS